MSAAQDSDVEKPKPRWLSWGQRSRVGGAATNGSGIEKPGARTDKVLDMNLAETYGVQWDIRKCGRDAWQNFFDQNGGTLDGVKSHLEEAQGAQGTSYTACIEGDGTYDYRLLTVIGGTTKKTGESTAGGFGEGAKILALSLLRDHGAKTISYRSADWELSFYIDDMPAEKVATETRGLFARVQTGLPYQTTSQTRIEMSEKEKAEELLSAKKCFRSSENPDFQDPLLRVEIPHYGELGIKYIGITRTYERNGRLYVAGQQREYLPYGGAASRDDPWNNVGGISIWTSRDIAPGDRDRGALNADTIKRDIFRPLAESLGESDIRRYFASIESSYGAANSLNDIGVLSELIARKGKQLGVKYDFPPHYVAVKFETMAVMKMLSDAGYTTCAECFGWVGMQKTADVMKLLHEHERVEPSPEQQARIDLLQEALEAITSEGGLHKKLEPKDIWLYSKEHERSPFEGSYNGLSVWISEEHLWRTDFATVFATYLHELDHKSGTDQSEEFSYALTDTLAEVIHAFVTNKALLEKMTNIQRRWAEITPPDDAWVDVT